MKWVLFEIQSASSKKIQLKWNSKLNTQAHIYLEVSKLRKSHSFLCQHNLNRHLEGNFKIYQIWNKQCCREHLVPWRKCHDVHTPTEWPTSFWRTGSICKFFFLRKGANRKLRSPAVQTECRDSWLPSGRVFSVRSRRTMQRTEFHW